MNKIIKTNNGSTLIIFNAETQEVNELNATHARIDYLYIVKDECIIEIDGENVALEPNDIIFKMYSNSSNGRDYIIIKNEKLVEHMEFKDDRVIDKCVSEPCDSCCEKTSN